MDDAFLREQLVNFLQGGQAHMTFEEAVKDFPLEHINDIFPHGEYSFWQLLEHIRLTQKDLLNFMTDPDYKEPEWPKDYWPGKDAKATPEEWQHTIQEFEQDLQQLIKLVQDPQTDLSAKVPNGTDQIYLREFMLVIDHNSYQIGEFAIMRQTFHLWNK